jgi:hypothetical protein
MLNIRCNGVTTVEGDGFTIRQLSLGGFAIKIGDHPEQIWEVSIEFVCQFLEGRCKAGDVEIIRMVLCLTKGD